jgi:hypothetical protein
VDIYSNRVVPMWNKVAAAFGIKTRLDGIKGFAKGGIAPGSGNKDTVPAMLTPGEGILTLDEMKKLGGPGGFKALRQQIAAFGKGGVVPVQHFADGGVVGFIKSLGSKAKSIVQGIAGTAISPLVTLVKRLISSGFNNGGVQGLFKAGANKMIDGFLSWVKGKDKAAGGAAGIGGGGGAGMGWAKQWALIHGAFPSAHLISGFRPGATTLSGNQSYHAVGRAIDVSPMRAIANWIRAHYGSSTKELITPWPALDLWNGKFHDYSYAIDAQHGVYGSNAHVHWAMDGVTKVEPGPFMGVNRTGKTETLVNSDLIPGGVTFNGPVYFQGVTDVKAFRDELKKISNRNGGRAGLPVG